MPSEAASALGAWLPEVIRPPAMFVTLTFSGREVARPYGVEPPWGTWRTYDRRLGAMAYGVGRLRGARVRPAACAWERHRDGAWHAHALLRERQRMSYACWRAAWPYGHVWIRPATSQGIYEYATKYTYTVKGGRWDLWT